MPAPRSRYRRLVLPGSDADFFAADESWFREGDDLPTAGDAEAAGIFPETLLWQPGSPDGQVGPHDAEDSLADNITTWKLSVMASTLDGKIATGAADIRAFQPFFAELDPPKVLTVGDVIHLPVTVRNYLEKPQSITLDWAEEPWSVTTSARTTTAEVAAGDYTRQVFSFRARLPMKDAKQRLTAYNGRRKKRATPSRKKLRVHADGQERVAQANAVFTGQGTCR